MSEWQPIETAPERRTVLVFYRNELGKGRTMRATFYPAGTLDMDDDESADENGQNAESRWFEESDAYEYLMPLNGTPTHWMPLPDPPVVGSHGNQVLSEAGRSAPSEAQKDKNDHGALLLPADPLASPPSTEALPNSDRLSCVVAELKILVENTADRTDDYGKGLHAAYGGVLDILTPDPMLDALVQAARNDSQG